MKTNLISLEKCKYWFDFDLSGNLYWKRINEHYRGGKITVGSLAGSLSKKGYYYVYMEGKIYKSHRILYQLYHNVELTETQQIDHINRDKTDNRKENLKPSNCSENCCNRDTPKNNITTGYKNITIEDNKKGYISYRVSIRKNRKLYTKRFPIITPFEQVLAYRDKELIRLHGPFASFG